MLSKLSVLLLAVSLCCAAALAQEAAGPKTPAQGYDIHVSAPHVVDGKQMGPYHHYCKVMSSEPRIVCLIYESTAPGAMLMQVEYIWAKSLTRPSVPLKDWNKNWHDHKQEIATGRVQVHDLPPDKAKEVADLVATTDGIIFHLWSHDASVPSGDVIIAQSVGHVKLTDAELKKGVAGSSAAKPSGK